jgi:S-adenosylmethionine:tRNA ribosyltransferase-isomerase
VRVSEFDYHLPDELIAQEPLAERSASRLLHLNRQSKTWVDRSFRELPELLRQDDLLVFNNTRVIPARLFGHRAGLRAQQVSPRNPAAHDFLHGKVEVLLIGPASSSDGDDSAAAMAKSVPLSWNALVHPGKKIGVGEQLHLGEQGELQAEVMARGTFGERTLRFEPVENFWATLERIGHVPLPPYIGRADRAEDRERYQTVFAQERGSVAAPTAGLHFTPAILDQIRQRGIETAEVTLHVGLGTFQPVRTEQVEEHKLHREFYSISAETAGRLNRALAASRRIVAVGTTTVRTLEYAAQRGDGRIQAGSGEADLFIYPGYDFRVVGALLTNFHLPKSSLLMLVCALADKDFVLAAYRHAVEERYRFYSYGDCMLVE